MMIRREISGLHKYDRKSGLHVLFDEVKIPVEEAVNCGPRHLSLMLTRRCNLNCPFCYVEKSDKEASMDFLMSVCEAAKELQVLDLTLGGGEPTLHKSFVDFVTYAWKNYTFGLSVTTNALNIAPLLKVAGMLSSVRVSTDKKVRPLNQKLSQKIANLAEVHKVGANILWSPGSTVWVRETINSLASLGTSNFLLIPEHNSGVYVLNEEDWFDLDQFVSDQSGNYEIMVTSDATKNVTSPFLSTESDYEYSFAHIDESGYIRKRSWGTSVGKVREKSEIIHCLKQLNPLRRNRYEDLV